MAIDPGTISEISRLYPDAVSRILNLLIQEATLRWDDLTFAAGSITVNPVGQVASPARDETETDFPGTLLFAGNAVNVLANTFQLSHDWYEGSKIRPHIHWTKPAGGEGDDVTWEFYYRFFNLSAAPGDWVGPIAGVLAVDHGGIAEAEAITTFGDIDCTGRKVSQNIAWRLYRRGNTDDFSGTARLIEFDVHLIKDSRGSPSEFSK
jgi:hypothetical protein